MQVGWCKVGEFLPVNNLRLIRTTAADVCSSATTVINNIRSKSLTMIMFITRDVGLKAHSHLGDINEVSRQFIAVLVCQYNTHFSRGNVNGL